MEAPYASRCYTSACTSKQHRSTYYDLLDLVRREGDWEAWLDFFLEGVWQVATAAVSSAQRLDSLFQQDRAKIEAAGRRAGSALRVHEALKERPVRTMRSTVQATHLSLPAVSSAMNLLAELEIARELTGRRRNRVFAYDRYLAELAEGTELT